MIAMKMAGVICRCSSAAKLLSKDKARHNSANARSVIHRPIFSFRSR
jgi:hypothetical protein